MEWNSLDSTIPNIERYSVFKYIILKVLRPPPNSVNNCRNPEGIKCVIGLHLGLIHLREYKFKHSFQDSANPM